MIQGFANGNELLNINGAAFENGIDIWSSAVYTPRKFGHAQTALVENGFNKLPNVKILLRGHCIVVLK